MHCRCYARDSHLHSKAVETASKYYYRGVLTSSSRNRQRRLPDDEEINADCLDNIWPLHLYCHSLTTFELALVDLA